MKTCFLLQKGQQGLYEERLNMLSVLPMNGQCYEQVYIDNLDRYNLDYYTIYIPVGSVEFTKDYANKIGCTIPSSITYPVELSEYFVGRNLRIGLFSDAKETDFVKPTETKLFTGGIKNKLCETVSWKTPVWIADPIEFGAEFRFYIHDREIIGYSQYDDGEDDIAVTESMKKYVEAIVSKFHSQPIAYTIDIGIVGDNKFELIEVNDAWALGYYKWGTMSFKNYIEMIKERWLEIMEKQ